jgi:RNA recognition motif-containing protein
MSFKLFVGRLPYRTTDDELQELFAAYGEVISAKVITDRDSGQSKGFAFVEMASKEEGEAAVKALDGSEVAGRTIVVNEARPKEDRPRGGGGGGFRSDRGGDNGLRNTPRQRY